MLRDPVPLAHPPFLLLEAADKTASILRIFLLIPIGCVPLPVVSSVFYGLRRSPLFPLPDATS